jgi:transposase
MQILKAYDRARFGRRSEKLGSATASDEDAQQAFLFEEIETGISALRAQVCKGQALQEKRAPRPRKGFPPHLERVEVVIEPDDLPEHAGKQKVLIGEDVAERLDVIPAKFRVIITRRPKYAFKGWDGVIQALAPNHIIESGLPSEALLAQIAVSKYTDGLPLYRQEGIYARDGVDLDRRLMAQWMGRVGFELDILADHVLREILKGDRVFADETSLPTLAPGNGRAKKPGSGPMLATTRLLAEAVRRWWPIALRTAGPEIVCSGILGAIAVSCRWTAMPPTTGWHARTAATMVRCSQDAGRTADAASMNCTRPVPPRSPRQRSK